MSEPKILLTRDPIQPDLALNHIANSNAGANLLFMGTTRQWTDGVETVKLNYECYPEMAKKELLKLCVEASQKWQLTAICVIHRLGTVPVGEASLALAVSSAHRIAAFEAGQWFIDTLKQVVPIWKQEVSTEGQTDWVHPEQNGATK